MIPRIIQKITDEYDKIPTCSISTKSFYYEKFLLLMEKQWAVYFCFSRRLPSSYVITLEHLYSQEQQHCNGCTIRQQPDLFPEVEELCSV